MLIGIAVAIVSLFALYVVAMNAFLSTSLFGRTLNGDPDTLWISYERGWSIWPGTVHAKKLTIRSQDSHVQWLLRIEECTFDISFYDLALAKKFHVTKVRGSGVTFDAREKLDSPLAMPEYLDAMPSIPGYERIPFKPFLSPEERTIEERATWNDDAWHLWTVQLDDVVAEDVRSVWIDSVRFEGDARITGGFYLKPIRSASIGPIDLLVRRGRATAKGRVIVDAVEGTAGLRIEAFDPRAIEGPRLLHGLSFTTDLRAHVPDLANVPETLTGPITMQGAAEVRRLVLRVDHGYLASDTHVDVQMPHASVEGIGHRARAELTLRADVPAAPAPSHLAFRVEARNVDADRTTPGIEAPLFRAPVLDVSGDATSFDLANPIRDLHVVMVLPHGEMADARALGAYVPPDTAFGFEGGRAKASVKIEMWPSEARAKGEGALDASDLDLRIAKTRLFGGTKVDASFGEWRWAVKRLGDVHAKVHVAEGYIATQDAPKTHLVDVRGFDMGLDAPEVDLVDPLRAFDAKLDMPDSEIVDRGLLHAYLPKGKSMKLVKGHARFDAHCQVHVKDHQGEGTLDFHAARFGLELDALGIRADVKAHARVREWAWEQGDLAVDDATVEVTKIEADRRDNAAAPGGGDRHALAIAKISVHARSERFSFSKPLQRIDLRGEVSGGALTDPIAFNAFLPKGADVVFDVSSEGARFEAKAHAMIDNRVARGRLDARGSSVGVRGKKVAVRGDVDATFDVAEWRLDDDRMRLNASRITIGRAIAKFGEALPHGAPPEGAPDLEAKQIELRASARDLHLAHPSLRDVDYHLVMNDGTMPDVTRLGALFSRLDARSFAVESGRARLSADIEVTTSRREARGGARLVLEDAGVRLHETHVAGDFDVDAVVKGLLPDTEFVDVSGSRITMRHVRATGGKADATAWNGDLVLLGGSLRISESPAFDGLVQLKADNANPILAMALGTSLPKFVVGMLEAPELSGQARLTVEPGRTGIRDLHVRGGNVVAVGDYVVRGDHVRGEVVVHKGALSAGVKVDDQGTYVRLFRLEGWRQREKAATLALFGDSGQQGRLVAEAEADAAAEAKAKAEKAAKAKAKAKAAEPAEPARP